MLDWINQCAAMAQMISEVTAQEANSVQSWLQLATSGGFAALTWYLIVYAMPYRDKVFNETIQQIATEFAEAKRLTAVEFGVNMDRCRVTFENTMASQRVQCKEEMGLIADQYEKHINRLFDVKLKA